MKTTLQTRKQMTTNSIQTNRNGARQRFIIYGSLCTLNEYTRASRANMQLSARIKREQQEIISWAIKTGLKGWKTNEGIPDSLLCHLIEVFDHLSGSSYDFVNRFKAWLEENYQVDSLQMKHRKGKRILNEYRLAFLEYKGDNENIERTPEMDYMFTIADGVDAEHGFDAPIDESEMCDAIEYAEENGYEIYLEPDEDDIRTKHGFGIHNHIRFKPKGGSNLDGAIF